jgi:glycosyltransferase involved in cell wall biosynthesis
MGKVVVYPIRMTKGYFELQAGSTFSIWPSMYEPFGGASEFLLRGTPVIARSTGGLRQQIKSFESATGTGNGILYETAVPEPGTDEWRKIQGERIPRDRMAYPIYQDQVDKLVWAIEEAVRILREPKDYGRLLGNTHDSVAGYSWGRAETEYGAIYDIARG